MWKWESHSTIKHCSGISLCLKDGTWSNVLDFTVLGQIEDISLIREGLDYARKTWKSHAVKEPKKVNRVRKVPGKNTLTLNRKRPA